MGIRNLPDLSTELKIQTKHKPYITEKFPIVVTNFSQNNIIKQHKCITLRFWRSEGHSTFYWAKIKVSTGSTSSEGPGGQSVSLIFPASRGYLHSLAH